jgi:hypothetical protein
MDILAEPLPGAATHWHTGESSISGTSRYTIRIECSRAKMDGRKRKNLEDGQADHQKVR